MGFKIQIRMTETDEPETLWESEGDHQLVDWVSCMTHRGEAGRVQIDNTTDRMIIQVNVRDNVETSYGDLQELEKQREKEAVALVAQEEVPVEVLAEPPVEEEADFDV